MRGPTSNRRVGKGRGGEGEGEGRGGRRRGERTGGQLPQVSLDARNAPAEQL